MVGHCQKSVHIFLTDALSSRGRDGRGLTIFGGFLADTSLGSPSGVLGYCTTALAGPAKTWHGRMNRVEEATFFTRMRNRTLEKRPENKGFPLKGEIGFDLTSLLHFYCTAS